MAEPLPRITLATPEGDHWMGLYVDGTLRYAGPNLSPSEFLAELAACGYPCAERRVPNYVLEETWDWRFPEQLADVPGERDA